MWPPTWIALSFLNKFQIFDAPMLFSNPRNWTICRLLDSWYVGYSVPSCSKIKWIFFRVPAVGKRKFRHKLVGEITSMYFNFFKFNRRFKVGSNIKSFGVSQVLRRSSLKFSNLFGQLLATINKTFLNSSSVWSYCISHSNFLKFQLLPNRASWRSVSLSLTEIVNSVIFGCLIEKTS